MKDRKSGKGRCAAWLLVLAAGVGSGHAAVEGESAEAPYPAPVELAAAAGAGLVYVAERGANRVTVIDAGTESVRASFPVPDPPGGLALSPDGTLLFVTGTAAAGRIHVLDASTGEVRHSYAAGHYPLAPVVDPTGETLWFCNRFLDRVTAMDVATGKVRAAVAVPREPVAAVMTPDGSMLVVGNHLPDGAADGDYTGAVISLVDPAVARVVGSVPLPNGSTGLRGLCLSPDGRFAYATHILGRYGMPTTQLDRGWVNTNALSVVDVTARRLVATVLLDDVDLGAANPWGVACTEDGARLCVAHAGTHELSVIDRLALHAKLDAAVAAGGRGPTGIEVASDLSFLVGLRRRVRLVGNGPRGVAIVGGRAFVAEHFSDTVGVADLASNGGTSPRSIALAPPRTPGAARRGERLFHDAELCFQSWQSCASCHPDARADGLNWDLLNDGLGNPKNVKSMLLAHATPPTTITAIRANAEESVRSGIRHIHAAVRAEEEAGDIDAYLRALRPVVSPHLAEEGRGSDAVVRGKAVFERVGCAHCHPAPLFTDLKQYDVGTTRGIDAGRPLDTPTLVEVWRTAPYLHDGRFRTLRETIAFHDAALRKADGAALSEDDLDDLTEFVSTR